ncbi:guanosine-5'-triphosphate,3'-diphosphate diphosphatase [Aliivibrio fischeri]|uniref:guanosine-5'-triphosphate,3'-diphosphate diphosphatase n=1 Tax=Aliivibrio fischeri TaxID=668 RepID=UPI0012D90C83|nr:guanosine-5'-triphosphate,3'-diphosphate diphosphatase [Aliivibrio fischeri]MUH96622.1 guanosine-5'-triphosphate,3'-diphosphate diphosphatase [Aliivibrio fischeri]MUI63698.1 guanosine-5'-triphosphate,3'-diphosphate diphosphatase [Aliivibrio fischeri]
MKSSTISPMYAAIDLGSNSFHMLVVRHINGSVQTMAKIKRKVRLAAGLNENNTLSHEAMQRGWDCLSLFAERLQDIPVENIRIVGTATLRVASNVDIFLEKANQILGHNINVIEGEEEARMIYQGVAHTSGGNGRRLVVDIGGASTELIIGEGFEAQALTSLKMGCVTWLEGYFKDRALTQKNFDSAIAGAKATLAPILQQYTDLGWQTCVGASGTVQALQEIMLAQGMDEVITLAKLKRLQKQAMQYEHLEELDIDGLTLERALVFPSGLSILIAIFELLNIDSMTLAGGALREGLCYGMIDELQHDEVCQRTIKSTQQRYQLDVEYAQQVTDLSIQLVQQCGNNWLTEPQALPLLTAATQLHEIGMCIDYKKGGEHSAYLINALDLPGFTRAQKHLLGELLRRYREYFSAMPTQHAVSDISAQRMLRILRLAIILTHRRDVNLAPAVTLSEKNDVLSLSIDGTWLAANPLTRSELEIEADKQTNIGWDLVIEPRD